MLDGRESRRNITDGDGNSNYNTMKEVIAVPDTLNVKEGFHHDLKAKAIDELRGPTFP